MPTVDVSSPFDLRAMLEGDGTKATDLLAGSLFRIFGRLNPSEPGNGLGASAGTVPDRVR
jgi:hypothetical protein